MSENEQFVTSEEVLLPEGYTEDADFLNPDTWADGTGGDANKEKDNRTTDVDNNEDAKGSDGTKASEDQMRKISFTARIDHENQDVELNEDEIPAIYQKSKVTDRLQAKLIQMSPILSKAEKLAKMMGYSNVDEMLEASEKSFKESQIEELINSKSGDLHREVIEDYVQRRYGSETQDKDSSESNRFQREVTELFTARPDLQHLPIPDEVLDACVKGGNLLKVYTDYEKGKINSERNKIEKENKILKQNATAASQAPVKGVNGGGKTDTTPGDPFLKGLMEDEW